MPYPQLPLTVLLVFRFVPSLALRQLVGLPLTLARLLAPACYLSPQFPPRWFHHLPQYLHPLLLYLVQYLLQYLLQDLSPYLLRYLLHRQLRYCHSAAVYRCLRPQITCPRIGEGLPTFPPLWFSASLPLYVAFVLRPCQ